MKTKRVLIVDDSEIAIQLLRAELEGKGFELLAATTAEEATRIITKRKTRPDLILLDINMPNVDGTQFCRFVKKNEMFSDIKVVLCSGMDRESIRALVDETGADGFVCKDEYLGSWVTSEME
jgi:CheY-like chemotaxis protein